MRAFPSVQAILIFFGLTAKIRSLNAGGAGSKARAQAQQVSLIDFDDDEAFAAPTPPAASTPAAASAGPSNPLDDLASLSLGGPSAPAQQNSGAGSLFDLNDAFGAAPAPQANQQRPNASLPPPLSLNGSAPLAPVANRPMQPLQQPAVSGTFFSNQARYSTPGYQSPSPSPSPSVSTFGGGSSAGLGSISLGGAGTPGGGGGGRSSAPPVPPKQQPQKDAFADLLGDF